MIRLVMVPAQFLPSLDAALDKVLLDTVRPDFPEFGLAPCRPGEMIEISIRRVMHPEPPMCELVREGQIPRRSAR